MTDLTETQLHKNFEKALLDLVEESPSQALSLLTGCFVGLTLSLIEDKGFDTNQDIRIDGGENRDITIHPPKSVKQVRI